MKRAYHYTLIVMIATATASCTRTLQTPLIENVRHTPSTDRFDVTFHEESRILRCGTQRIASGPNSESLSIAGCVWMTPAEVQNEKMSETLVTPSSFQ